MAIHFEWTETMSVGENTIDAQHKRLLAQVNKLIDAMIYGAESKEVTEAVDFLGQYATEHLAYEEKYMTDRGYHDLDLHKIKHQDFRDSYSNFESKLASGTTSDAVLIEMEEFLGHWWVEHIGYEDQKYHQALGRVS